MRHAPTSEPAVTAAASDFDEVLGVYPLFLVIPRAEAVYFRLAVESWEDFAVARTMQRFCDHDRTRSIVVVMAVADFLEPCLASLSLLCGEVEGRQIPATPELRAALRRDLLDE